MAKTCFYQGPNSFLIIYIFPMVIAVELNVSVDVYMNKTTMIVIRIMSHNEFDRDNRESNITNGITHFFRHVPTKIFIGQRMLSI